MDKAKMILSCHSMARRQYVPNAIYAILCPVDGPIQKRILETVYCAFFELATNVGLISPCW